MIEKMNIERVKAIVTIIVTAIVNIVNLYGYAVDADAVVTAITTIASFACIIYSWWFNQNVTEEAQAAQVYLNELKKLKKEGVSVDDEE